MKIKLIFIVLITFNSLIFSQSITTDRPDQTESSFSVEVGQLQVESGILVEYSGKNKTNRNILLPSNLFRYGIYNGTEVRILNQFETSHDDVSRHLVSDTEIGLKVELCHKNKVKCALLSHFILPTGSDELSEGEIQVVTKFCISEDFIDEVEIAFNVGYSSLSKDYYTYSLAIAKAVNESVGVYIEPFGEFLYLNNQTSSINTGITYLLNANLQLDYSFGLGLNHKMNYASIGFSWRVG